MVQIAAILDTTSPSMKHQQKRKESEGKKDIIMARLKHMRDRDKAFSDEWVWLWNELPTIALSFLCCFIQIISFRPVFWDMLLSYKQTIYLKKFSRLTTSW